MSPRERAAEQVAAGARALGLRVGPVTLVPWGRGLRRQLIVQAPFLPALVLRVGQPDQIDVLAGAAFIGRALSAGHAIALLAAAVRRDPELLALVRAGDVGGALTVAQLHRLTAELPPGVPYPPELAQELAIAEQEYPL